MIRADSPEWQEIKRWAEAKLARHARQNESLMLTERETMEIRCHIKALKELLALPSKPERQQIEPDPPYDE